MSPSATCRRLVVAAALAAAFLTVSAQHPAPAAAGAKATSTTAKKAKRLTAQRRDTVAPRTRIRGKHRKGRTVRVAFGADERARYQCRVDRTRWKRCTSPVKVRKPGKKGRRLDVRAIDRAGNIDPTPASTIVKVASPAPSAPVVTPQPPRTSKPPAPARPAAPIGGASTQGPGFQPLSDAEAAARVARSPFEPRPENATANSRVPTAAELDTYYRARTGDHLCSTGKLDQKVTGNFTGTTDEILQWGAHKWGIDAEILRAMATVESWWRQGAGDATGGGLLSIVWNVHKGTFPLGRDSTAFNVDFLGAVVRHYHEGCATWLNDVERGHDYAAGDIWGSVGAWYAGRWHTQGAEWYIDLVKTTMAERRWAAPAF